MSSAFCSESYRCKNKDWCENDYNPELDDYECFEPMTNADRIRQMSDEELSEFLLNRDLNAVEKASKAVGFTYKVDREKCLVDVIDWMKQEVEIDGKT